MANTNLAQSIQSTTNDGGYTHWMANINLAQVIQSTVNAGGHTHWNDGNDRDAGYCVGNNNTSLVLDLSGATDLVAAVLNDVVNINRWLGDYGNSADGVGFWLDGTTLYIDATTHFNSNQLPSAITQAIANNELSIYAIHTENCLDVNPRDVNLALSVWASGLIPNGEGAVMLNLLRTYVAPVYDGI